MGLMSILTMKERDVSTLAKSLTTLVAYNRNVRAVHMACLKTRAKRCLRRLFPLSGAGEFSLPLGMAYQFNIIHLSKQLITSTEAQHDREWGGC